MILLKKQPCFLVSLEGVQLPHVQVLRLGDRALHRKILSKLNCNSKFNFSLNFNFVLSTSKKFYSESKLGKGCSRII